MIGAYVTFVQKSSAPLSRLFDYSLLIAVPLAFLCRGIGVLIERGIIRFLYGRRWKRCSRPGPFAVLQQAVRTISPDHRESRQSS